MVSLPEGGTPGDESLWPSVPLAYEFVRPSYEIVLRRLEAVENRLRALQTLAATLALAAPAFAAALLGPKQRSFASPWFLTAMGTFGLIIFVSAVAPVYGRIRLVDPGLLYTETMHLPQWQFQMKAIYEAALDFQANTNLVNRVGKLTNFVTVALLIEGALLAAWLTNALGW